MIELRAVGSDDDLEAWASVKSAVVPNQPVSAEQLRSSDEEGRLLLLAEADGEPVGCGIAAPSHFDGLAFVAARVLLGHRRRGIGTAIAAALIDHARALGRDGLSAFVDAADPASLAFVERYGLSEVDHELEQRRVVGDEHPVAAPDGMELIAVGDRREDLLRAVWPIAQQGYADMPLPGVISYTLEEWLREEATIAEGSFVALDRGEPVGYAGLLTHAEIGSAHHGLTVVRRDRRRHGVATALKRAQLNWAAQNGLAELITWTQRGNEAMQALNRRLGYVDTSRSITFQGPLPSSG
jgi:GNAT superfamily N-acetyltransferase